MFQKHNRFYADWKDRRGVRRRKAFVTAREAEVFELTQKSVVRPKTPAQSADGLRLRVSSMPLPPTKSARIPSTTLSGASLQPSGRKRRATLLRSTSLQSSKASNSTSPQRGTRTTRIRGRSCDGSPKATALPAVSGEKSLSSTSPRRVTASSAVPRKRRS